MNLFIVLAIIFSYLFIGFVIGFISWARETKVNPPQTRWDYNENQQILALYVVFWPLMLIAEFSIFVFGNITRKAFKKITGNEPPTKNGWG